jgi:eukaryotic-like serine/threonine-protein kinase
LRFPWAGFEARFCFAGWRVAVAPPGRSIHYYRRSEKTVEDRTVFHPFAGGSVKPGTRLNGLYEIEKLIAQGGMGEVYRGFNIQTMDPVAIKMIRIEFSNNQEIVELFRREASILHNLPHEAIVRYFVFSVDPDLRRAYLAMEFVEGPSLTDRFATGPIRLADVQILRQRIASALELAHQYGVVHRDISPDNIILPQNDVRRAKVIDFGIARSLFRAEASIIGGRFAGKYNFASPEQFGLAGGEVGLKSDIYSFGLVLAAALRGSPIDMSGSEVEAITKRSVLPDLSDIDPTVRPLLQAMLQPAPANRPASMAEVAAWEPGRSRALWTPSGRSRGSRPLTAPATRKAGGGRTAAVMGAAIVLASLGGAAFVFRNDLRRWPQALVASAPPPAPERLQTATGLKQSVFPPLAPKHSPTSPPQGQREANDLGPEPSSAPVPEAPANSMDASDRESGQGARPTPLGKAGPSQPGPANSSSGVPPRRVDDIVSALRRAGERPESPPGAATEAVHNPQPQAPESAPGLPPAVKSPSENARESATEPVGAAKEQAPLAPAEVEQPPQPPQIEARLSPPPLSLAEKARRFVATFNGGDCFFIKRLGESGGRESYLGFGREQLPFQRFDTDYKTEVGAEADIRLGLINLKQCAVLDLIRLGGAERASGPRIELGNDDVGRGKPLTGRVMNLAGRSLYLILVDNEGLAYRLDVKNQPRGDAAAFNIPLTPDAGSAGADQVLLAIVSDAPIAVLDKLHRAPLQSIAGRLVDEARRATAFVEADYFKFAD